jgi:glucosyl-dolichyl phosphate glucuronosyltransferase
MIRSDYCFRRERDRMIISVIVPTYNRATLLNKTLTSLSAQEYPKEDYEIIVVDNSSTDNTKEVVHNFAISHASVRYVYAGNPGLHNARHAGAEAAKGEILLYIDDDVLTEKKLLLEIVKIYSAPDVGCVGGKILPLWESEPPKWIHQISKSYLSILDDEEGPKEVKWIYGCNFAIRKDLLFKLEGFNPDGFCDPKMWWYRGDGEYGLLEKVHQSGHKVLYTPNAIVWHFIPQNRLTLEYFKERAFKGGIEASYRKYRMSDKLTSINLLMRSIAFRLLFILTWLKSFFFNDLKAKVKSKYFEARSQYDYKLIRDINLRSYVKKENYWNER